MLVSSFQFSGPGFDTLNHHHQVIPMDVQGGCILIKGREFKTARFQLFIIYDQTRILHMQDLHDVPPSVDENEYSSVANILVHGGGYNTAQGIKATAHIYRHGIEIVFQRLMQVEHGDHSNKRTRALRCARSRSFLIRSMVPLG